MSNLDEPVNILAYQPAWCDEFESEHERISAALGIAAGDLQHIGSTAVPGLAAKPIVDLMLGATRWPPADLLKHGIECLGYEPLGEAGVPGRLYFRLRGLIHANLHVVPAGGTHWVSNLALRDYLRANKAARERYAQAKFAAIENGANTLLAYSAAKAGVVDALLKEALAASRRA